MSEPTESQDDRQARVNHAQELLRSLGPLWQPQPMQIEWVGTADQQGQKIAVMVITDLGGRRAYGFPPEELERVCNEGLEIAGKAKQVQTPLTIAKGMPQGMPMPGVDPASALRQR